MKVLHFKTAEAYRKWNAYRFIHGKVRGTRAKIYLHGKLHKVKHGY